MSSAMASPEWGCASALVPVGGMASSSDTDGRGAVGPDARPARPASDSNAISRHAIRWCCRIELIVCSRGRTSSPRNRSNGARAGNWTAGWRARCVARAKPCGPSHFRSVDPRAGILPIPRMRLAWIIYRRRSWRDWPDPQRRRAQRPDTTGVRAAGAGVAALSTQKCFKMYQK